MLSKVVVRKVSSSLIFIGLALQVADAGTGSNN